MKKKCSHLFDLGGFLITELSTKLLLVTQLVLERVSIALKLVPSLHLALQLGVLVRKLLCVVDHLLNVLGRQPVLVVGDGDLFLGASALVLGALLRRCRNLRDLSTFKLPDARLHLRRKKVLQKMRGR